MEDSKLSVFMTKSQSFSELTGRQCIMVGFYTIPGTSHFQVFLNFSLPTIRSGNPEGIKIE